jgi:UDP:flavonoid glycosyltransferase YjiC (YdhE family)
MPSVWDGHDNAKRVAETGHGCHLHRNHWKPKELRATIESMLMNEAMQERLAATSTHMRSEPGPTKAAAILDQLLQ